MAPKPKSKPARLAFTLGMVLAMAVAILAILTWTRRDLAAPIPPTEPIYQPQHLILY
jgi:heme A synthase